MMFLRFYLFVLTVIAGILLRLINWYATDSLNLDNRVCFLTFIRTKLYWSVSISFKISLATSPNLIKAEPQSVKAGDSSAQFFCRYCFRSPISASTTWKGLLDSWNQTRNLSSDTWSRAENTDFPISSQVSGKSFQWRNRNENRFWYETTGLPQKDWSSLQARRFCITLSVVVPRAYDCDS
jgi:hypothetical protein